MTIKRCPKCKILFGPTTQACYTCGGPLEFVKGPKLNEKSNN